jgi:hypothetical protein
MGYKNAFGSLNFLTLIGHGLLTLTDRYVKSVQPEMLWKSDNFITKTSQF